MSTNTSPTPTRPTFGVEIEFLVAVLFDEPDPDANVKGLPPPLRIPRYYREDPMVYVHKQVKEELDGVFGSLNPPKPTSFFPSSDNDSGGASVFATEAGSNFQAPQRIRQDLLRNYREFGVVEDCSVTATEEGAYRMVSIEVTSPVQFASPQGFEAISLAISTITSKFRSIVNIRCGLHVHVGLVRELLSLEQLRRFASFVYAAEPLLYSLHDPIRYMNRYSRPLQDRIHASNGADDIISDIEHITRNQGSRIFARRGRGSTGIFHEHQWICHTYTGQDRRHGEEPLSARESHFEEELIDKFAETRQSGHFEPFTNEPKHTRDFPDLADEVDPETLAAAAAAMTQTTLQPARERTQPRLRFEQFPTEKANKLRRILDIYCIPHTPERDEPPASVFELTRRMYVQPSTCQCSELMQYKNRPSITIYGHGCYDASYGATRRTIEYRMGSGSLDGDWIATWAKICVGIFSFSLNSSPSQFIDVLTKIDEAMKGGKPYDIVDLLDDIGLFAEAEIAEKRLLDNRYLWDVQYDEPEHELLFG